ncbi:MAG TPA: hypothetical protein VMD05_11160 [Candidatus Nanoarchaeia archaeon]|nr:hypothetical protein [Candidatus Nanoarchaeia archaeon]
MKTRKIIIAISIMALLVLPILTMLPVNATDPTINTNTWFVLTLATGLTTGNNVSYVNGGSVLHNEANYTWNIMRSPQVSGTVQIGTAASQMTLDFNNVTNTGTAVIKFSFNFTETNSTKNPYGVGTLGVLANVNLTSMMTGIYGFPYVPANGTGTLVSTSGTGAFAYAKLYGDLLMNPLAVGPLSPSGYTEALFFGTHPRVNGTGVLIYYPTLSASAFCSSTVLKGQTWYFFVQSTGGIGSYAFQWYEGSTLLTGQNSMILSMNKATAGTYSYTCAVTDAYGNTVTTNAVVLTVV